ncbi:MAG: thiamine pyrophosphate-binding protein, partial [Sandaracinaceae bacterium]
MSAEGAPTGADRLARRLHDAGCRTAFGIPGGEVLALIAALDRAGIAFHLVRHENAGGFLAEGTHHVTGAPGVLVATVGPGVTNVANVAAHAHQDRVPLVIVTGAYDPRVTASYTHQIFDHRALLAPVVKATFGVPEGAVEATVDKALAVAMDARPGPVHLDLPIGVATSTAPEPPRRARPRAAAAGPAPSPALDAARRALR